MKYFILGVLFAAFTIPSVYKKLTFEKRVEQLRNAVELGCLMGGEKFAEDFDKESDINRLRENALSYCPQLADSFKGFMKNE